MEQDYIELKVQRLTQGKVPEYIGKIKARDILALFNVHKFEEETLEGYQREVYKERKREIAEYIEECPIPIIPTILASIHEDPKYQIINNQETIKISKKRGSLLIMDGQHRIAGFDFILGKLIDAEKKLNLGIDIENYQAKINRYNELLDFEIPILIIDSTNASEILEKEKAPSVIKIKPDIVEGLMFYIINKTQKGIRPSLQDTLRFMINKAGIKGIPSIDDDPWRLPATDIGHRLNSHESPLKGQISLEGAKGSGRPIQLNSWVTSLKQLYRENSFTILSLEEQYSYIEMYWKVIKQLFSKEFENKKDYLLLKTIGVYSLNWLSADIFKWINEKNMPIEEQSIQKYLLPLKNFNWSKRDPGASKLKGLGGQAGVKEAYKILLEQLKEKGVDEAKKQLEKL
jgi:hypothetical protein